MCLLCAGIYDILNFAVFVIAVLSVAAKGRRRVKKVRNPSLCSDRGDTRPGRTQHEDRVAS